MRFETTLLSVGNNVGIEVPIEVVEKLGAGSRPLVVVTVNDSYTYRSAIAVMAGKHLVSFSSEHRAATGLGGGDQASIEITVDTEPRIVDVHPELQAALDANPTARGAFDALSNSKKKLHTLPVAEAKTDETRARRIAKSIDQLSS